MTTTTTAAAAENNLRQRKATSNNTNNKKKKASSSSNEKQQHQPTKKKKSEQDNVAPVVVVVEQQEEEDSRTLWQTFRSHWSFPFYAISVLIGVPYALYWFSLFLLLQRPDWILQPVALILPPAALQHPFLHIRPAVGLVDVRQVLIVGTMSSGTSQVAHELQNNFRHYSSRLEVGHETSETLWNFARDGTVSWFHGIRFLPRPTADHEVARSISYMCDRLIPHMGFHPRMFRDTSTCSTRDTWSVCWSVECHRILQQEWGCAWSQQQQQKPRQSCISPFATTLHQVRHPLDTLSSLIVKFCHGGSLQGSLHSSFIKLSNGLFGHLGHNFSTYSCLQGASHHWLEYTEAMIAAKMAGLINHTYSIETTTPCQVLRLAGFLEPEHIVYAPHLIHLQQKCQEHHTLVVTPEKQQLPRQHVPMVSTKYSAKKLPDDFILVWDDLKREDAALFEQVQWWTRELGYELNRPAMK